MSSKSSVPQQPDKGQEDKPPEIYVPELPDKPPRVENGQEVLLDIDDVLPGDVLLSTSTIEGEPFGYISWLVRKLDQDWYSHAAFFDGDKVIESGLSKGVEPIELDEAIKRNRYTDVYRFASDACRTEGCESRNCRTIDRDAFPIGPLRNVANDYVAKPYATHEAILLGLLMLRQRKLTTSWLGSKLLKSAINAAIAYFRYEAKKLPEKAALTCSELVYRIFDEAETAGQYRLIIGEKRDPYARFYAGNLTVRIFEPTLLASVPTFDIPVAEILSPTSEQRNLLAQQNFGLPDEFSSLIDDLQTFADEYEQLNRPVKSSSGTVSGVTQAARPLVLTHNANMISPSDLRNSGNLREIGRLRKA